MRTERDVRLVIVDPLNAYLAGVSTSRDGDVRATLAPLIDLARKHGFAIVGVVHLNKSGGNHAMYRSLGSIGIQGVARTSWQVTPDPDGAENARLFLPVKFNVGKRPRGISFSLVSAANKRSVAVIRYEAFDVTMTADDAITPEKKSKRGAVETAVSFLATLVSNRKTVTSKELYSLAKSAGISHRSIDRAKKRAGVETFKQGRVWRYRVASSTGDLSGQHSTEPAK